MIWLKPLTHCTSFPSKTSRRAPPPESSHLSRVTAALSRVCHGLSRVKSHQSLDSIDLSRCHGSNRGCSPYPFLHRAVQSQIRNLKSHYSFSSCHLLTSCCGSPR